MKLGLKVSVLAAAVSLALAGAAAAQTGRSSKNPEAGPAGSSSAAQAMRRQGMDDGTMAPAPMKRSRKMRRKKRM